MKPWNSDKNPLPEFNIDSDQIFEEFVKIKKEFILVDPKHLEEITQKKVPRKRNPKTKVGYSKDLINKIAEDPNDIIDTEIVEEAIKIKIKKRGTIRFVVNFF